MKTQRTNTLKTRTLAEKVATLSLGELSNFWELLGEKGRSRLDRARQLWDEDHAERNGRDAGDDDQYDDAG